ncbi:MAG: DUF3822 family protein [Bacteroidales bacterium]
MPFFELFDETLDINSTSNYELSVELSRNELAYAILDDVRKKIILLRSHTTEDGRKFPASQLEELFAKDDFLRKEYRKIHILTPSRRSTLVPAPLYDPARKEEYFSFNHNPDGNTIIQTSKVQNPDAFLLFETERLLMDIATTYYPGVYPVHHLGLLLNIASRHSRNTIGHFTIIDIEHDFFTMLIFENNVLVFNNSFIYRNISDIIYFTLNAYKSSSLNQEGTIWLCGKTEKYDDLFSNLSAYIRNVKFIEPTGSFSFSYVFNDLGLHKYLNLFSTLACE